MANTTLIDDPLFMQVLDQLTECFTAELEAAGGGKLCYCGLIPGDIMPLDLLTDGCAGVAWIRPMQVFPSLDFPNPAEGWAPNAPLAMSIEVGVARRYPLLRRGENGMDPERMRETTRLYMSDRAATERALQCCLSNFEDVDLALGTWEPLAAQGGASGGLWTAFIGG